MSIPMLKIGVIGLSEGNGHPYSWSAILNGYNPEAIKNSSFPNITNYLAKQNFPDDQIPNAAVTHVWTQDTALSKNIAESCHIPNITECYEDMIGQVDAVLLARDDHENHMEMAHPFIEHGLPIFIDKPLATSVAEAEKILALETYKGQIFSCTALRYAEELFPTKEELKKIGPVTHIMGSTVKSWDKYAIHLIEPVLNFIGHDANINNIEKLNAHDITAVIVKWDNNIVSGFQALGSNVKRGPIGLTYYGKNGFITKQFDDAFNAFKTALIRFIESVHEHKIIIPREETLKTIRIIEEGLK